MCTRWRRVIADKYAQCKWRCMNYENLWMGYVSRRTEKHIQQNGVQWNQYRKLEKCAPQCRARNENAGERSDLVTKHTIYSASLLRLAINIQPWLGKADEVRHDPIFIRTFARIVIEKHEKRIAKGQISIENGTCCTSKWKTMEERSSRVKRWKLMNEDWERRNKSSSISKIFINKSTNEFLDFEK